MLFQVVEENGQKKIQPLTADTGAGAPVGSYLYLEKKSNPQGYLYCDGSTFDETVYPALYQYLGTNVLPDWREFSPVGAEQNTTNVYDAQTNPNGIIHDHDVYTEGQAKDDQVQHHYHRIDSYENGSTTFSTKVLSKTNTGLGNQDVTDTGLMYNARIGDVTRGKRKAVFIYIKATSGLTENQQENVLNTINQNLSYSTTEHKTGKKWIDGKDIYNKVCPCNYTFATQQVIWTADVKAYFTGLSDIILTIDSIVSINLNRNKKSIVNGALVNIDNNNAFTIMTFTGWDFIADESLIIIEYTKTTD